MRHTSTLVLAATLLATTACGTGSSGGTTSTSPAPSSTSTTEAQPETLTLLTHDSFAYAVNDQTFAPFTTATGIDVEVQAAGDAGALVNQAVLTKDNPLGDVLFGVDDTFLSRALDEGIFVPYTSSSIGSVDQALVAADDRVTPIDFGDVCFNYDKAWFADSGLSVPTTLEDLTDPAYAQHVTVEHPATSSPGLALLLATVDHFGESGWLDWWRSMREAGVDVAPDWDTAYYVDFTRYGGDSSIVTSYASSPPAEVIFSEEPLDEAPTGVIEAGCYRQVEYAGILRGTEFPGAAGRLIDYLLSVGFQDTIPLNWFVFPSNGEATLPQEFVDYTVIPDNPARLDPATIAHNRERWINQWVGVMEG